MYKFFEECCYCFFTVNNEIVEKSEPIIQKMEDDKKVESSSSLNECDSSLTSSFLSEVEEESEDSDEWILA